MVNMLFGEGSHCKENCTLFGCRLKYIMKWAMTNHYIKWRGKSLCISFRMMITTLSQVKSTRDFFLIRGAPFLGHFLAAIYDINK